MLSKLNNINSWSDYNSFLKLSRRDLNQKIEDGNHRCDSDINNDDIITDDTGTESRFKSIEKTIQTIISEDDMKGPIFASQSYSKKRRLVHDINQSITLSHNNNVNDEQNDCGDRRVEEGKDRQENKMQWMRPNPSLFFQLASECAVERQLTDYNENFHNRRDIVVAEKTTTKACKNCILSTKASKMVNQYHKIKSKARIFNDEKNKTHNPVGINEKCQKNHHQGSIAGVTKDADLMDLSSFIEFPTMKTDLTQLMSPHLMSQWVPGGSSSEDIRSKNSSLEDDSNENGGDDDDRHLPLIHAHSGSRKKALPHDEQTSLNTVIKNALEFSMIKRKRQHAKDSNKKLPSSMMHYYLNTFSNHIQKGLSEASLERLKHVTNESWILNLPSHVVMKKIETYCCHRHDNDEESAHITLMLILLVLIALVLLCDSQSMGIHVLNILCPSLFCISRKEPGSDDDLTDEEAKTIQVLAVLLVNKCNLGDLSKVDLRNYLNRDRAIDTNNNAWNELYLHISRAYYNNL